MNEVAIKDINIENLIYEVRGKQVMLDSDLAVLYDVETKRINEAVKNNPLKFPERFSWIITREEWELLKSKFSTLKNGTPGRGHYRKYLPRVFTEQGIAMLATILKSNIATRVSIRIMDAFVIMKHYISNNLIEQKIINNIVLDNQKDIKKIKYDVKLLQESFQKFEEKKKINEIYFDGQIYDSYSKILEIFKGATNDLIIIDAYADNTILDIIKRLNINVTIITKKDNLLTKQDVDKYNKQYCNLKVIYNNTFHDRYFILDNKVLYHCGTSINRIGYKTFSITLVNDKDVLKLLLDKIISI